ncbi:MAG: DUF4412 domain-containing protein [Verrucomicrobiota bacterium]
MRLLPLWTVLLAVWPAAAQQPQQLGAITDKAAFLSAAMSEFLSDSRAFTATGELRVTSAQGESPMTLPFTVAMLNGRMRWDLNLTQAGSPVPAESMDLLKQIGLDRIVLLMAPNEKMLVAFPTMKAYLEQTMPKDQAIEDKAVNKLGRFVKTPLGKETIDGHPCMKYRLSDPKDTSGKEQAVVWQAEDLNDLPIRLYVKAQDDAYDFRFKRVRMGNPDERVFARPVGFTKHESTDSLMAAIMAKSLGEGGLKGLLGGQ